MRIAIVTMEVKGGHCAENFAYIKEQIEQAKKDHADMIVFPQSCINGVYGGEHFKDADYCRYVDSFNDKLKEMSQDIAIVWGNIKYRGRQLFNCAFFAYQGELIMRVKEKQSTAFVSEEMYSSLPIHRSILFQGHTMEVNFGNEVQDTDWNINLDARPFDIHHEQKLTGNVIYVNAVGMQNEGKRVVMMEGGSAVYHQNKCVWQMPYGEAGCQLVDTDQKPSDAKRQKRSLLKLMGEAVKSFDQQILGGKSRWIVGLSGGLDSSVSAALLVYALGNERVIGYGMSSHHNSEQTKQNARALADALAIEYHEGSITSLTEATDEVLMQYGYPSCEGLVKENVQARIRGHLLSTFAAIHKGVVVNNGNKVENALGYCTLYGDAIGAIDILGDLTKVQLFDLSHALNQHFNKETVPVNLLPERINGTIRFSVPPSAELTDHQQDPMKWFYHDYLVDHIGRDLTMNQFLNRYLDGSIWNEEIGAIMRFYHLDDPEVFLNDLNWFTHTAKRNLFKHTQVPVILTVSQNAYSLRKEIQGFSEGEVYQELLDRIKQMKK